MWCHFQKSRKYPKKGTILLTCYVYGSYDIFCDRLVIQVHTKRVLSEGRRAMGRVEGDRGEGEEGSGKNGTRAVGESGRGERDD